MPATLAYHPTLFDDLISNERLDSYRHVFQPDSDIALMGVYLWNAHVCGAIYPLMGAAEISLRNAIDRALRSSLGEFWWSGTKLKYRSFLRDAEPPMPVQLLRENFAKATNKYRHERRTRYGIKGHVPPEHNGVISKTDFSTWGLILSDEFMGNGLVWPSRLGAAFAGVWPSSQAGKTLSCARDLVSVVRDFRNRVFHHEPAWKRYGIRTQADALAHLEDRIDRIVRLLSLVHPENVRALQKNGLLQAARRACTSHEIDRFQHIAQVHKVASLQKLQQLVDQGNLSDTVLAARLYLGRQRRFLLTPA